MSLHPPSMDTNILCQQADIHLILYHVKSQRTQFPGFYFFEGIGNLLPDEFPGLIVGNIFDLPAGTLSQHITIVFINGIAYLAAIIADHLDIPVGTVHSRIHRALKVMHAAIDADERVTSPAHDANPIQQEATR